MKAGRERVKARDKATAKAEKARLKEQKATLKRADKRAKDPEWQATLDKVRTQRRAIGQAESELRALQKHKTALQKQKAANTMNYYDNVYPGGESRKKVTGRGTLRKAVDHYVLSAKEKNTDRQIANTDHEIQEAMKKLNEAKQPVLDYNKKKKAKG